MGPGTVLYVEDDPQLRCTLATILENRGFLVAAVGTVPEALACITDQPFNILLSDLNIGSLATASPLSARCDVSSRMRPPSS